MTRMSRGSLANPLLRRGGAQRRGGWASVLQTPLKSPLSKGGRCFHRTWRRRGVVDLHPCLGRTPSLQLYARDDSFRSSSLGNTGSKHRRHRASYVPVAPTKTRFELSTSL